MEEFNKFINYKDKKIHFKDLDLAELVKKYKTPFYLYSEDIILDNLDKYQKASKANGINSTICFALKSNNNIELLKSLAKKNCGADIVSSGELIRAIEAGIAPKKIVFSGVGKTREDIELGIKHEILSFNVESISELKMIGSISKEMGVKTDIAFRLNPKVHAITHKHISTGFKTHKFGLLKEDILLAMKDQSLWSHCNLIGLSVHIGSQLLSLDATKEAIHELCKLAQELDCNLEFLDVGGGLGVDYNPRNKVAPSTHDYVQNISNITKSYFPDMHILFEPGRSISASAGFLLSKVIRTKTSEECNFLIVDGGMNDFVRPSLYGAYHEIYASIESESLVETDIVGPICETADCFGEKRSLPLMNEGDFILISHTGAYGHTMSSHYNMRPQPKEYIITIKNDIVTC